MLPPCLRSHHRCKSFASSVEIASFSTTHKTQGVLGLRSNYVFTGTVQMHPLTRFAKTQMVHDGELLYRRLASLHDLSDARPHIWNVTLPSVEHLTIEAYWDERDGIVVEAAPYKLRIENNSRSTIDTTRVSRTRLHELSNFHTRLKLFQDHLELVLERENSLSRARLHNRKKIAFKKL